MNVKEAIEALKAYSPDAEVESLVVSLGEKHWSSCAVHNAPALPVGPCDCGGYTGQPSA